MRFADPELFALLALLPLFGWLLLRDRRPPAALQLPAIPAIALPRSWRSRLVPWLPLLRLVGAVLVVLAIARPQAGEAASLQPAEGIDIVLALDVSGSMEENKLGAETRLEAARRVARDFVARRGEDRLGLLVFQAESLVLSPLTLDHTAIDALIDVTVQSGLVADGTAIGLALAEAVDLVRESDATSRVVVLLTDGENNQETVRPVEAAAIAEVLGVRVYTIGITDETAQQGPVDELALRYIADLTGGQYFRATDPAGLKSAYRAIDRLERERVDGETFTRYRELAFWFLIPGIALIVLEVAAHSTWWRRAP